MQEITEPDAYREEKEQRDVAYVLQWYDSLPNASDGRFHLIIYRELTQQEV